MIDRLKMQRETQVTNASYELTTKLLLLLLANSNDKNGLNVVVVVVRVIPERNARRAYEVRVLPYLDKVSGVLTVQLQRAAQRS